MSGSHHKAPGFAGGYLLASQHLGAMADVIRETSERECDLLEWLERNSDKPIAVNVLALVEPLISVVLAMAGVDPDEVTDRDMNADASPSGISFDEHFANLYRIGTGWLGYAPAVVLASTPAEITEAYTGRVDMLKAIFGSASDKSETIEDAGAGLAMLRAMSTQRVGDAAIRIY